MDWQEKLAAMQSLEPNLLKMRFPGEWACSVPGEIGGDGLLTSTFGQGHDPESAVNDAWGIILGLPKDRYLRIKNRNLRWIGFMFSDVETPNDQRNNPRRGGDAAANARVCRTFRESRGRAARQQR